MTLPRPIPASRAALLAAVAASLIACAPVATRPAPTLASGIDRATFDTAVRPQDDLYRHVNGHWLETTPLPPDKAYIGSGEMLHETTQQQLRALIEAAQQRSGDPEAAQLVDLYASFMDEATVDALGARPLAGELAAIEAVSDRRQLGALMARLSRIGVDTLVIDRFPRVGDCWRQRYHSLALHNDTQFNHLPYMPFPDSWPTYLPKDMVADWFEAYAWAMEINFWTSTELVRGRYDESSGRWDAVVRNTDGTEVRGKHRGDSHKHRMLSDLSLRITPPPCLKEYLARPPLPCRRNE